MKEKNERKKRLKRTNKSEVKKKNNKNIKKLLKTTTENKSAEENERVISFPNFDILSIGLYTQETLELPGCDTNTSVQEFSENDNSNTLVTDKSNNKKNVSISENWVKK